MLNFDFLDGKRGFTTLHQYCHTAEITQKSNPAESALNSRRALETIVDIIYFLKSLPTVERESLHDKVTKSEFVEYINDDELLRALHYIRKVGNRAAHVGDTTRSQSFFAVLNLYDFVGSVLVKIGLIDEYPPFNRDLIPDQAPLHVATPAAPQPVEPAAVEPYQGTLDTPLTVSHSPGLTEAETRQLFIDMMLREAGWDICTEKGAKVPGKACIEIKVNGMPNAEGVGYVDYVLYGDDLRPLAIIEAKRTGKSVTEGYHQSKLYAECLAREFGYEPCRYCSNGFKTEVFDMLGYPKREVFAFHSKRDLQTMLENRNRALITDMHVNKEIAGRYYQIEGIKASCEAFNQRRRHALIVLATGTGKTRLAIGLTELLQRNNWVQRVLFLADRRSLVRQACRNFTKLLPHVTTCDLTDKSTTPDLTATIIFSTYHTMIKMIDSDDKQFSVGHFNMIVVDEAHRSVFGKFGDIFHYFDALLLGLTATPREDVDRSTYELFHLEDGIPTADYPYDQAVKDGFLVPYRQLRKESSIIDNGITYDKLSDEEKEQMEQVWKYEEAEAATDPDEETQPMPRDINPHEIFKYIYNEDTVRRVLTDLMTEGLRINGGDTLGKTIIFAFNHKHAELIVKIFNEMYPELGPDFCQLIDNQVNWAQNLIDRFGEADKLPQIAVSVDMLDTGIDMPEVLNLVFFKKVFSKIKFNQMIGRGTRLCPGVFGDGEDKKEFYIFDYCRNFEYFSVNPDGKGGLPRPQSLTERLFNIRVAIATILQKQEHQEDLFARTMHDALKEQCHAQVCGLSGTRIDVRRHWEWVHKYQQKGNWTALTQLDVMRLEEEVAPLLIGSDEDVKAKAFDLIMLNLQLSTIEEDHETQLGACQVKLIKIASLLEQKASIPQVLGKMKTIKEVQTEEYWQELSLSKLERVRGELRDLIKFITGKEGQTFVVNITDIIRPAAGGQLPIDTTMTYKQKVLDYLKENSDSPVLKKIYNLEQLTAADVDELERVLWQELGSKEDYDHYVAGSPFGGNVAAFIRRTMNFDYNVAMKKFEEFVHTEDLNAQQIEYLHSVLAYVSEYGDIIAEKMAETAPFNEFDWFNTFGDKITSVANYIRALHKVITISGRDPFAPPYSMNDTPPAMAAEA